MRRLPLLPFIILAPAFVLGGCIINLDPTGSSPTAAHAVEPNPCREEYAVISPDKLPPNAPGLNVVYGETPLTDITAKEFPDVIVRGKYPKAELMSVRVTAVTSAGDGPIGRVSQIQIYNAGVTDREITIRIFALDADGILRARKEDRQALCARDIVIPENTGWNESPGSKLRYTIIVE